jgi:signal transduction histidine kinase
VAGAATVIGMGSYVLIGLIFNYSLIDHMTSQVDARLSQQLTFAVKNDAQREGSIAKISTKHSSDLDDDDAPIFVWRVASSGTSTIITPGAPRLPREQWIAGSTSMQLGRSAFRFRAVAFDSGYLVAAESVADIQRLRDSLLNAELIFGAVLLVLMYGASFVVGIRALSPIARAQRREREFTADASHELRTPLSVIEAEVSIALSKDRDAKSYRSALERIGGEGHRLQRLRVHAEIPDRGRDLTPSPHVHEARRRAGDRPGAERVDRPSRRCPDRQRVQVRRRGRPGGGDRRH